MDHAAKFVNHENFSLEYLMDLPETQLI